MGSSSNRYAPRLPQQETKPSTKQLAPTDPILVRNTFSKPASLKRASLVALPVAISHKVSLKPKLCASATLIQKTSKNEPKHGPKKPHAQLSKRTKKKHFHGPFLRPSGCTKMRPQNRKIHSKGRPLQQTKIATAFI